MRILLAPNAFKGSLTALQVADILSAELSPTHITVKKPLADGGDGTLAVLHEALPDFELVTKTVTGPHPETKVETHYLWSDQRKEAFIEMALASGLAITPERLRNPENTTTFGTGELIADAIERGAKSLNIAIGGSATNDCAIGGLSALGFKFLDASGEELKPVGGSLEKIAQIKRPARSFPKCEVLCDVTNPLYGPNGAAYVYGPQKGADSAMVARLDAGLRNIATIIQRDFGLDINTPGAGAAGGFGGGMRFGLTAQFISGIECVARLLDLEKEMILCDCVITGEGRVDSQSLQGKVLSGVMSLARKHSKPVLIVAGGCEISPTDEVKGVFSLLDLVSNVSEAINRAPELLNIQARNLLDFLASKTI